MWKQHMAASAKSSQDLLQRLGQHHETVEIKEFPARVPQDFINRMDGDNYDDPLLRQVLPREDELVEKAGFHADPLAEHASCRSGYMEKYHSRVLITLTGACAIHCRYCFRRHFPYSEHLMKGDRWSHILHRLAQQPDIKEVIFSGGDPLSLGDDTLNGYIQDLNRIPHIKRLRIHTRLPVVIPSRVTQDLLQTLCDTSLKTVMVLHINHPQEIDEHVKQAVEKLSRAGVNLFNQSVLLSGVNDDTEILVQLCESLFELNIVPYYLHMLDKVQGAAHFEVPWERAQRLYTELKGRLSGYLVPRMVREQAGAQYKQDIFEL